jgi:hypothetical protein
MTKLDSLFAMLAQQAHDEFPLLDQHDRGAHDRRLFEAAIKWTLLKCYGMGHDPEWQFSDQSEALVSVKAIAGE